MTKAAGAPAQQIFTRFDLLQRAQHIIFLISFTLLGFTGLPQKFPLSPISLAIFNLVGGIENARSIHHTAAIAMTLVSVVHILEVFYRLWVLRSPISMIPWINDLQHVINDVMYYLGLRKHKGYYGRYSYAEKMEYLALIWGTVVMALTGFMMWNPITTVNILPGEAIPAAKAAHGGEAILAVLAIIIWHFYHVHIKTLNKSMFTGKMTRAEMEHEHPAELAAFDAGRHPAPIPPAVLRQRQLIFAPIALVILVAFGYGLYFVLFHETTAVTKLPTGETAKIFSPLPTPTPLPPTPTQAVVAPAELSWDAYVGPLFQQKCAACHGASATAGLNLSTYADAIKGATTGAVIVPKDSAGSKLIQVQEKGSHPGQLSPDEITFVKQWIDAGAPGLETAPAAGATAEPAGTSAPASGGAPNFATDLSTLLTAKCIMCHQGAAASGGLDLTSFESLMKGGKDGVVIVPGDAAASKFIQVQSKTHAVNLTPEELTLFKKWIDAGASGTQSASAPAAGSPTFDTDIAALLTAKCIMCHQGASASGGLDLTSFAAVMKGGKDGPVIVPGDPTASKLIIVQSQTHAVNLTPEELTLFKKWIEAGAIEK
ncbi:MAG TPA: c-type cytochrome domain-containing protein [Anaerolineales bacterium]|jgi:cytochrome b subunit of formate dehydrogenase